MPQLTFCPQFAFNLASPAGQVSTGLPLCPVDLLPEAVVSCDDEFLSISDLEIQKLMREMYSASELTDLLDRISSIAQARQQHGDRAAMGLGGPRTYQDVGTATSAMDWMHEHELKRTHQIKLSLPSAGEEALAARERIQQRIAARRRGLAR